MQGQVRIKNWRRQMKRSEFYGEQRSRGLNLLGRATTEKVMILSSSSNKNNNNNHTTKQQQRREDYTCPSCGWQPNIGEKSSFQFSLLRHQKAAHSSKQQEAPSSIREIATTKNTNNKKSAAVEREDKEGGGEDDGVFDILSYDAGGGIHFDHVRGGDDDEEQQEDQDDKRRRRNAEQEEEEENQMRQDEERKGGGHGEDVQYSGVASTEVYGDQQIMLQDLETLFRTRNGLHTFSEKDRNENGFFLEHLTGGVFDQGDDKLDCKFCEREDYIDLAHLMVIFEKLTRSQGTFLLTTLNDIMRRNEIPFRFFKSWETIMTAMNRLPSETLQRLYKAQTIKYELPACYWGDTVHITVGNRLGLDTPYGVALNPVYKIMQAVLLLTNPDEEFRHLPQSPDRDGQKERSFFSGKTCMKSYSQIIEKVGSNRIRLVGGEENDKKIFSRDDRGRLFEHVIIYFTLFTDRGAMQKNKNFSAEPVLMQILNIAGSELTLLGYGPDITTSKKVLRAYLKKERHIKAVDKQDKIIRLSKFSIRNS